MLARILVDPQREYNLSELVAWTGSSMPTIQREVDRAERAGIVVTRKVGPARLVRANVEHPLHQSVQQLVLGTYGPPAVIAREFADLHDAEAVILFGSWAARYLGEPGRAPNDIDVLVIGSPDRDRVDDAAERAERQIGLPVQATIRSRSQWLSGSEAFIAEVKSRPFVVVLTAEADNEVAVDLRAREDRSGGRR
jgi:hypothetical protein